MNGSRKERMNVCRMCLCVYVYVYILPFGTLRKKKRELKAFNSKQCVELNQRIFRTVKLKGGW